MPAPVATPPLTTAAAGSSQPHPPTLLHLFSGPTLRTDGVRAQLAQMGWDCSDFDIVNVGVFPDEVEGEHDLSRDARWTQIIADLKAGEYAGVLAGTPCETASRARTGPPGPRPLRSPDHLYGLPRDQLTDAEYAQVRLGTYFALKTAEVMTLCLQLGIPWAIENPDPDGNPVSLFNLPEWRQLAAKPGVRAWDFHQCPMGAETAKPTRVLASGLDLTSLIGFCNHPPREWHYQDHRGRWRTSWGPHPPIKGRRREDGTMATKAAAAYPGEMNRRLATAFTQAAGGLPTQISTSS